MGGRAGAHASPVLGCAPHGGPACRLPRRLEGASLGAGEEESWPRGWRGWGGKGGKCASCVTFVWCWAGGRVRAPLQLRFSGSVLPRRAPGHRWAAASLGDPPLLSSHLGSRVLARVGVTGP